MRAKMRVSAVLPFPVEAGGAIKQERLMLGCVAKNSAYPEDGHDEDNSFAKFSPSGVLDMMIMNPACYLRTP